MPWIAAGAALGGALISSGAADDAAGMQTEATREANAINEKQFNTTRSDLAPFRQFGTSATSKLSRLLGLDIGDSGPNAMLVDTSSGVPRRNEMLYSSSPEYRAAWDAAAQMHRGGYGTDYTADSDTQWINDQIRSRYTPADTPQDSGFGSLLKDFTGADLVNEPGYKFGLEQGQLGIDRRALAGGRYFSGGALKEAARYGTDYAGTKFGEGFNRDSAQKTQKYNFLTGAVNTGQNSAAMTGQAGAAMAGQVGANTTGLGNALGAAAIAGGNAVSGGINSAVGGYQQQQLIDEFKQRNALNRAINGGNTAFGQSWGRAMNDGYDPAYG